MLKDIYRKHAGRFLISLIPVVIFGVMAPLCDTASDRFRKYWRAVEKVPDGGWLQPGGTIH